VVTNPFHALSGSKLALDLVRLNPLGNRATGIAPRALEDNEIFGDAVHSPCDGTVAVVRDTVPDNAPGSINTEYPEGNYIVVRCADVEVLMAHLRHGSISASAGEAMPSGRPLGQVGNSGNTLEPHLHVEARKDGARVCLVFDSRRLSLNSVVIRTGKDAWPPAAADRT